MSQEADQLPSEEAQLIQYDVFALAEIQVEQYAVLAERVNEKLAQFRCERSSHLERFARESVHRFENHGHSRTYVIITPSDDDIDVAAFFTVGMTALDLSQASGGNRRRLMGDISLEHTGAYSLAELARSDDYTSAQLPGSMILDEAKGVVKRARQYVGGRFLVVDARVEVFEALYKPAGFRQVSVATPPRGMEDTDFVTACAVIKDW